MHDSDTTSVRLAVAGCGAFGNKHLAGLDRISEAHVTWLVDDDLDRATALAAEHGNARATTNLDEVLADDSVDGVILATPTPLHSTQAVACLDARKHVEVEIPAAESLVDARSVAEAQHRAGKIAMVGHTRRFNPSHQYMHRLVSQGEVHLQHLVAETYFFRRTNLNALGEPRSWTDNLLWHHAAHTVDLFAYQCGAPITTAHAVSGNPHPELGIPMDMSIQLRAANGALCSLALSFNNEGPFGTTFRYICDNGTFLARYDDLLDGNGQAIDLTGVAESQDGIELQDREFINAIREGREPLTSIANVMPCYEALADLQAQLDSQAELL